MKIVSVTNNKQADILYQNFDIRKFNDNIRSPLQERKVIKITGAATDLDDINAGVEVSYSINAVTAPKIEYVSARSTRENIPPGASVDYVIPVATE